MKLKVSMVVLLITSFINMGYIGNVFECIDGFYNLESVVKEKSDFVENAVKIQYKTRNSICDEEERIEEIFCNFNIEKYENNSLNQLELSKDKQTIEVNLWVEEDYSYIEAIIFNFDNRYETKDLKEILQRIEDDSLELVEYYSYYKGKAYDGIIDELNYEGYLADSKVIKINNGYTGVANLNSDKKINFAEVKYDTGSYIIIATPVIFTTY